MRKRIDYLDRNPDHRVRRAEALKGKAPGETVIVDGIEYFRVKQACINCDNLDWDDSEPFCIANSSKYNRARVKDLEKDQGDCDMWCFRE